MRRIAVGVSLLIATAFSGGCASDENEDHIGGDSHFVCVETQDCVDEPSVGPGYECVGHVCVPEGMDDDGSSMSGDADSGGAEPMGVAAGMCPATVDECWECGCANCQTEWDACMADEACKALMGCIERTGCRIGGECTVACPNEAEAARGDGRVEEAPLIDDLLFCRGNSLCPCAAISGIRDQTTLEVLSGVEMCFDSEPDRCASSNEWGAIHFDRAPTDGTLTYTLRKDGYVSVVSDVLFAWSLATPDAVEEWAAQAGVVWDDSKGTIRVDVGGAGPDPSGFDARLDPPSGVFGVGAPRMGESSVPRIWNADEGTYDVVYDHPTLTCANVRGPEGAIPGSSRVEVRAGHITQGLRVECQ